MSDDDLEISLVGADGGGEARGPITVDVLSRVLDEMDAHVAEDTSVEHGGVMVGHHDPATGTTSITGAIRALGAVSEVASLRFTHETWDHIGTVMEDRYPNAEMVGWYHSHPHFGIFLSEHDQFIHRNFFSQPWQVAYVRDPLLDQRGFFVWEADQIVQIPEDGEDADPVPEVDHLGGGPSAPAAAASAAAGGAAGTELGSTSPRPTWVVTADEVGGSTATAADDGDGGGRRRRWPLLVGILAGVLVVGGAIASARTLLADDPAPPTVELVPDEAMLLNGTAATLPDQLLPLGTVEVTDGDEQPTPAVVEVSSLTGPGGELEGSRAVGGQAVSVKPPADAEAGVYNGTLRAQVCTGDDEADCEWSDEVPLQITVLPAAEVVRSAVPASLTVGTCRTDAREVVDCDEPHVDEVYVADELPEIEPNPYESGFIGSVGPIDRAVFAECLGEAFEEKADMPYEAASGDDVPRVRIVLPSDDAWAEGNRRYICSLQPAGSEVVGTYPEWRPVSAADEGTSSSTETTTSTTEATASTGAG